MGLALPPNHLNHIEGIKMRDLTMHELDAQLAEQLPARELMQPAIAVAIGAIAVNVAVVNQVNVNVGGYDVTQVNAADIVQSATATNSGAVTAAAALN
jgi:hypothetical protein